MSSLECIRAALLLILTLLFAAGPVMSQEQHMMDKPEFKAFLSKLSEDSQRWTSIVSSVDIASLSTVSDRRTRIMRKWKGTCLNTFNNLQGQINALGRKNSFRGQIAVLNGLTNASNCLGTFQDTVEFKEVDLVKWEQWEADLTRAFEEATGDTTRMYVHMAELDEIVDSRIDISTLTKNDLKPAGK